MLDLSDEGVRDRVNGSGLKEGVLSDGPGARWSWDRSRQMVIRWTGGSDRRTGI